MKKVLKISALLCLAAVVMNSCRPDNDFTLSSPQNRVSQLTGTFKLQSVTQTDLIAKSNNFVDPARPDINLTDLDITNIAPFTDMTITLASEANVPSTFTISYGASPRIFKLTSGTWRFDNPVNPGKIKFISGVDTVSTVLSNLINLPAGMLTLQLTKSQGIKPVVQYNYNFKKN